ncbi:MAG: hypothetical protein IPL61_33170 [Myxococcales bacterium]|nr:hypothetical protein [Myxococcales bacterium]
MTARALALAATALTLGPAQAQPSATPPLAIAADPPAARAPVARPRLQLTLTGDLRVTQLDGGADRFVDDARAYGWRDARARPLLGGRLDAHYLLAPIVDVGVSASWMAMSYAVGIDDSDRMRVGWRALAVSARLHWAGGRPFVPEPRVDLGVADERWSVHGTADHRARTFIRVGADWRLGTRTAGVNLAVAYTLVATERVDGPSPPLGGLDLAVGPYLRF